MKPNASFREVSQVDRRLGPLIATFNFHPAAYAHESHWHDDAEPLAWLDWLRGTDRGMRRLSEILLRHASLEGRFCFDFAEPHRRLALLPADVLRRTLMTVGAVWWSPATSRVVLRSEREQLRTAMGEELYQFSLKRAPLFLADRPELEMPHKTEAESTEDRLLTTGRLCVQRALNGESPELTARLALKFPRAWSWNFETKLSPWQETQAWNFIRRILCKEVAKGWAPCFN